MACQCNFGNGPFVTAPEALGSTLSDYKKPKTKKYLNIPSFLDCGDF